MTMGGGSMWWMLVLLLAPVVAPEFVHELEVSEGAPVGTHVGYIGDGEHAATSGPPYLIVPVPGSAVDSDLAIDQSTGEIKTKVPLDRETRSSYSLVAIPLSGDNVKVVVRVNDENDNAPTFPSPIMHVEFPENTPRDVKRTLNPARDADLGPFNTQRYNIVSGNTDNAFRLSSHRERDGVLYLDLQINGFLDRETTASYSLVIEALDGGSPPLKGYMTVNITIQDVNDNQPIFNQSSYSATIPENATVGTSVLQVYATDADSGMNGQIEYAINRRQSDRTEMFRIDPETGVIVVNKNLDFETKELHELVVVARDRGLQPLETTAFVSIRVTDVNDNQPTITVIFLSDDATPKISESAQPGEFVARISVNDPDSKTEYSNVNVTLSGGDGKFGLTTRDNIIYLVIVSLPLDREVQPTYTLNVVATDTGSPPLHASKTIKLRVTDVNDNAPEFSKSVYEASVPELAEPGTAVLKVQAVDRDEGANSVLSYSLEGGGPSASWFSIDSRTGLVSTRARVDCETEAAPRLIVVARDGGHPPLSSSATILVTIHDVNDNEPIFDQSFYNVSVAENEPKGHCILKVSATDPDCGVNAMVNYTLGEGFGKMNEFEVKSGSGEICITNELDYETRSVYEFPVIATDRGGLSTTAMVKIQLTDVNDNRPIFYPREYNVSLREGGTGVGASATSPVVAVAATDLDSGRFGVITYRFVAGNEGGVFRIDRATGELFVSRPGMLSSRSQPFYKLNISATDSSGLRSEHDAEVFVSVVDSAQKPPIFEKPRYHYKIKEDVKLGTMVGTVKATGVNSNDRQIVKYSVYSGDPDRYFSIDPDSGIIRTASSLDHEVRPTVLLNVQASSGNPPVYAHTQVNIAVEDVNDNPPEFESSTVRISVAENLELGTPLYAAHARDRDAGANGLVRYRLAGQNGPSNLGAFAIDNALGYVTLTRHLDYEASQRHALTVIAYDGGRPPLTANLTLLVDVQDVNDNPPVFERPEYTVSVLESAPLDTLVVQVTAVDLDTGNNARLTYRLIGGAQAPFSVESHSGRVTLTGILDREKTPSYNLVISAADHGAPPTTTTARLSITVLDANDNDPEFVAQNYEFSVEENLPRGAPVGFIKATDSDIGDNAAVRYSLIPANTSFHIDAVTGEIITKEPLDRENRSNYELVAEAHDLGSPPRTSRVPIKIIVTDVNDNAPEVVDPREDVVSAREEQPPGTEVARVRAVDRDYGNNATITYSIIKGRDMDGYGVFTIDPVSGVIRTRVVLDHEERAIYRLAVAATDAGKPPKQTVRLLRVEVLDLNDNRPTFTSSSLVFSIREDVKVGHIVGSIACTEYSDQENMISGSMNRHVTYSLITLGGEQSPGAFDIDRSTGSLVVARQLDRENQGEYRLEVRALDTSATNNPQSSAVTIKVDIIDVNDNAPKWPMDPITIQIPEDTKIGAVIYNFTATDADSGLNGEIHYSLASPSSDAVSIFAVDPLRGVLTLVNSLDFETVAEYTLIVKATDQATNTSERLSTAVTVRIIISDANDNSPVFVAPISKVIKISESATVGTSLCKVIAVDADSADNGRVSYVISSGNDNGRFIIGYESGVITLARSLTSLSNGKFTLNITASDHGSPNSKQSHTVLQLLVQSNSDNPPRFLESFYKVNVSEDMPVKSFIVKLAAKSPYTIGANLTYFIPEGVANDKFLIDSRGSLRLRAPLDREQRRNYLVPVYADGPDRHDTALISVTVTDANDHAPRFEPIACRPLAVPENNEYSVIHTMVASDPDAGANGEITYSITSGNHGNIFSIDFKTGALSARPLDRETRPNHWLVITAQDGGSPPRHGSCNLTIIVEDLNDNAPTFEASAYTAVVPEDAPPDTSVLTVRATDPDLRHNGKVLYSIANESQWLFRIDNHTGVITTVGIFDRETQSVFDFLVVATDGGKYDAKSQTVPIQITIGDINDNKPVFIKYPFTGHVAALSQPGQSLLKVTAIDADDGTNAEIVYSLINELPNSKFRINPNSGILTSTQSLASENGKLIHLEVLVRDKGNPPQNATGLIEIRVGDVPDGTASLHFQNSTYSVSLMENAPRGKEIIQVSAVRSDGRRQRIVYSFGSGNEDLSFEIDPDSGIIRVANSEGLDHEQPPGPRRRLVVVARAEGNPTLYGYCEVWVHILDRNDNAPRFTQQQYTANVWEGNSKGTFVMQLSAKDADEGTNARVLYHIVDGNHDNAFIIEPAFSGSVKTNIVLDREIRDSYRLTVIATDGGDPQLTGTATLRVNVVDVNDNQPTFPPRSPVLVSEGTPVGSVVTTVTANDVDTNPALTYSLSENETGPFSIDRFSGRVVLKSALDYESRREYTLNVLASDAAHVAKSTLILRVTDDNDNSPIFEQATYSAIVPDGERNGEIEILRVNATDADDGDNSVLTYSLVGVFNGIRIVPSTGVIYANRSALAEHTDLRLAVKVQDGGSPPRYGVAALRIRSRSSSQTKPHFAKDEYRVNLPENTPKGKIFLRIGSIESDFDKNPVDFAILSGDDDGIFDIIGSDGALILAKFIDREVQDSFTLRIGANEREKLVDNDDGTSSITVHINVEDSNDNAPVFTTADYEYTISEGTAIGSSIARIKATDSDLPGGPNSDIVYDITSGNDERLFKINKETGVVSVNNSLEYDDGVNEYFLVVRACDSGTPKLCSLNNLLITLKDENDNAPKFPVSEYFEFVGENEPIGTTVFTARATDLDKGIFGTLNYSIVSSASNDYSHSDDSWKLFKIDAHTGLVVTNAIFDYEMKNRYAFTLKASDAGGKTASVRVRIEIESRDEFHPQFTERTYRFALASPKAGTLPVGYIVGHVTATDRDKGADGRVVYQLTTQHPYFKINRTTGAVIIKKKLDNAASALEVGRDISLVVTASSGRQGSLTNMTVVEIILDPLADINTNLIGGGSKKTAVPASTSGLADWALGLLIALILVVASFGAVFLFLHMRSRRHKKGNKPGLSSDTVGTSNSYVDPSAFDTIPIRGGTGVSGPGGQFAPPKYDEIPPYGPHTASSNSGAATTSELSGSEQSGSSGRGSAEDGEDGEDEEIRMINEGPLQRDSGIHRQNDDIDGDNLSDVSVHNTQEYLARLGIVDTATTGGASTSSRRCSESVGVGSTKDTLLHHGGVPLDPLHMFDEDAANENDITNLIYAKLNDVAGSDRGSSTGEVGAAVERAIVLGAFGVPSGDPSVVPTQGPSMNGSLSSIVHSEEELTGSYNWDYLLDWGPQYQPLAHVFSEIARLKDDTASVQSGNSGTSSVKGKAPSHGKGAPPPLLTNVAPRSIPAPALSGRSGALLLPRSPISHDTTPGGFSTSSAMSPSFSPSLSPLATRSPSISPLVPPGLHHARGHKPHHNLQDSTLRIQ